MTWTDDYSDDNPAVALYRRILTDGFKRYTADVHGWVLDPDELGIDEESWRAAADYCAEEC